MQGMARARSPRSLPLTLGIMKKNEEKKQERHKQK